MSAIESLAAIPLSGPTHKPLFYIPANMPHPPYADPPALRRSRAP